VAGSVPFVQTQPAIHNVSTDPNPETRFAGSGFAEEPAGKVAVTAGVPENAENRYEWCTTGSLIAVVRLMVAPSVPSAIR